MKPSLAAVLDASAIGLSSLCLIHCLVLPVAAALLPLLGAAAQAEWVHLLLVAVAAPLAGLALWRAHRRRPLPPALVALAVGGVAGLLAGALGAGGERMETPFTVAGSLALAAAHVWNWRRRPHPTCAVDPITG